MEQTQASPSLTTFRATPVQGWIAALVGLGIIVTSLAFIGVSRSPGAVMVPFLPAFLTAVFLTDGITAFLLYRQAIVGRSTFLAVLASAYLYSALIVIPHAVAFPGVFAPGGLFGAGPQTAVWLWTAWHLGWPAIVLGAIVALWYERRGRSAAPGSQAMAERAALLAGGTALTVAFIALVTFRLQSHLPVLVVAGDYTILTTHLGPFLILVCGAALGATVVVTRLRSVAHLWLAVALVAGLCDIVVTLAGGARFSIGWYVARFDSIVAASVVLGALLHEAGRLGGILADGERRLRAIVDGVADALLTVRPDGVVASMNPAAEVLFGVDAARAAGIAIGELVADYDARVKSFRGSTAIEALGRHSNGRTFPIELAFGGETDSGRIVIARDITQRRRAEDAIREARDRALEAANVKSTFLATMSHEIRTPINAIVGMSELLLQTALDPDAREYASTVRDSAGALLAVINDILDFSKIEAGKLEIDAIPFSVLATVESASDILAGLARGKGLSLSTYVAPDVPAASIGDPSRLRQILLNLIGNAVKFTESGSIAVRATVDESQGEKSLVRFEVADTGAGISAETLARLFEPFRQADSSTSRKFGGTGLGLSISKRLVELMSGTIGARSTVGSGSTFWFAVPLERIEDDANPSSDTPLRGRRVLVVEPEPVTRQILAQYLLSWGAVATPVSNAAAALDVMRNAAARNAAFHVAIIADDSSTDALGLLLRSRSEIAGPPTPLILLSGSDEPGLATEARNRGMAGFLRKPVHQSSFNDALLDALDVTRRIAGVAAEPTGDGWNGRPPFVLVAEDNAVNRRLASRQLERLGVRCELVADGREAVAAVARNDYDVVLMDCQMPEMDGFEATRTIRTAEAGRKRVPIVAMTANALEGDREVCLAAGMDDYLSKPVQLAELRAALERHAGGTPVAR